MIIRTNEFTDQRKDIESKSVNLIMKDGSVFRVSEEDGHILVTLVNQSLSGMLIEPIAAHDAGLKPVTAPKTVVAATELTAVPPLTRPNQASIARKA